MMKNKKILILLLILFISVVTIIGVKKIMFSSKKDLLEIKEEKESKEDNNKEKIKEEKELQQTETKVEEKNENGNVLPKQLPFVPKKPSAPALPFNPTVPPVVNPPLPNNPAVPNLPLPNVPPVPGLTPPVNPQPPVVPTPPTPRPPQPETPVEILAGQAVKTTYQKDGKKITTLWTKGITPPNRSEFREERYGDNLIITIPYVPNKGWYDVNKNSNNESDRLLCSGSVASNMLHWWLEQNKNYVDRYLRERPERVFLPGEKNIWKNLNTYLSSFENQKRSKIFDMFKLYYGNTNGIWSDTSVDFFINGYKMSLTGGTNIPSRFIRDSRGGFFYEVFGKEILTNRLFSGNYNEFNNLIKKELQNGNIIGLEHKTASATYIHIVTVWGADFDEKGKIIGIYISDSDDYDEINVGMRRLNVNIKNGKPVITSNINKNIGVEIYYLHTLSLGKNKWQSFFN